MGHPDEGRRGIILDPATLANERDRSTSPPHPMPRSTAIVQDDLDAVMELVKLQAPPPTTSLVPVRGREAMPSAFKPYHKIEATAPPNTKASWLPNNSQPLSGSAQSDVKFNQARRSLNVSGCGAAANGPTAPSREGRRRGAHRARLSVVAAGRSLAELQCMNTGHEAATLPPATVAVNKPGHCR